MADNNPIVPGAPKPPEGSKVQPEKETVRINLPPKPSAAPTIKLPTLPPGGPSAGGPAGMAAPAAPALSTAAAPSAARAAVPAAAPGTATPRPAPRPVIAASPAVPILSGVDFGLAIGAVVAGVIAIGSTAYLLTLFTPG